MKKLVAASLAFLAAAVAAVGIAEEVKSGLELGARPSPFNVKDCSGPSKGTSLCYRCKYGNRPTAAIFTRTIDDNVTNLIKELDGVVGKNEEKKMAAFVVLLSENPDKEEAKLTELASKNNIKNVPLTVFDGQAGPPEYKIAKDADVTVMMWNKSEVKANTSLAKGKLDKKTAAAVIKDTEKILN